MDDAAALTAIGLDLLGYMLGLSRFGLVVDVGGLAGLKPLKRLADDVNTRMTLPPCVTLRGTLS